MTDKFFLFLCCTFFSVKYINLFVKCYYYYLLCSFFLSGSGQFKTLPNLYDGANPSCILHTSLLNMGGSLRSLCTLHFVRNIGRWISARNMNPYLKELYLLLTHTKCMQHYAFKFFLLENKD